MADRTPGSGAAARAGWFGALVTVPLLLAGVGLLWPGPQLAGVLRDRSDAALDRVGLTGVTVAVSGRDVELRGVPAGAEPVAVGAVDAVPGVRVARMVGAAAAVPSAPSGSAPTGPVPTAPETAASGELSEMQRQELTRRLVAVLGPAPITFAPDSAVVTGGPAGTVARVAELLRAVPAAPVEVTGHVAQTPESRALAQSFSERRAEAVADALVAAGVDRSRVTTVGRADHEPLHTQAASRRVEIRIP